MLDVPSGSLSSTVVSGSFFCFLAQPSSTVRILLAHGLAIGQVLCTVDDSHEGANGRPIDRHIGEDAGGMIDLGELGHGAGIGGINALDQSSMSWRLREGQHG